jgi:hypothetical protein
MKLFYHSYIIRKHVTIHIMSRDVSSMPTFASNDAASLASASSISIPQQLIKLQCRMTGCKHRIETWDTWASTHLPGIWAQCDGCPLEFCKRTHRFFTESGDIAFKDWRWDFLEGIGSSAPSNGCNCVCGVLMIASACQSQGLLDDGNTSNSNMASGSVAVLAGPQHVWIRARSKADGEWWFLETTLRPHNDQWCISQAQGRQKNIYGQGAWFAYTDPKLIVQEAFINQLLLSPSNSQMRDHLYTLLEWISTQDTHDDGEHLTSQDCILDVRKLRVRQLTSRTNKFSDEQHRIVASILETIHSSKWPPEAYMKSVFFAIKWLTWCALCCSGDDTRHCQQLLATHRQQLVRICADLSMRLRLGHWTTRCSALQRLWDASLRHVRLWATLFPNEPTLIVANAN